MRQSTCVHLLPPEIVACELHCSSYAFLRSTKCRGSWSTPGRRALGGFHSCRESPPWLTCQLSTWNSASSAPSGRRAPHFFAAASQIKTLFVWESAATGGETCAAVHGSHTSCSEARRLVVAIGRALRARIQARSTGRSPFASSTTSEAVPAECIFCSGKSLFFVGCFTRHILFEAGHRPPHSCQHSALGYMIWVF